MLTPLLVFRVGYMPSYGGAGPISGGGAYIKEHGEGGEMWNFRVEGGRCYGYVMTRNFAGIDLGRINETNHWEANDELDGIDVVFIAKKPLSGQVVVGWYKGATVFHKKYRKRRGKKIPGDWDKLDYLCQADAERAVLLPEELRTFKVPSASANGKGFPGQSNVWYPNSANVEVAKFFTQLRKYIGSASSSASSKKNTTHKKGGWATQPGKDLIAEVEQAAISTTWAYFKKEKYAVVSVEKDNRGWDLEATKNNERLLIEVKGHIGNVVQFELTPNEYAQLQANAGRYRVCIVRNALKESEVEIYTPVQRNDVWILTRRDGNSIVQLAEKVAVRAFEAE